jgi:hypothetical protein
MNSKPEFSRQGFIKCLRMNSKPEFTRQGFIKCLRIKSELEFTSKIIVVTLGTLAHFRHFPRTMCGDK